MNKNSTSNTSSTLNVVTPAVAPASTPAPRPTTLDRLRQFARAYSYIPVAGSFGGIVLN